MPDVAEFVAGFGWSSGGKIELRDDARDISSVGFDRVFPGGALVGFGWHGDAGENHFSVLQVGLGVEWLAIEHLELHLMQVDGMYVAGGVGEGPDFHGSSFRVFGDGIVPVFLAEQSDHGVAV